MTFRRLALPDINPFVSITSKKTNVIVKYGSALFPLNIDFLSVIKIRFHLTNLKLFKLFPTLRLYQASRMLNITLCTAEFIIFPFFSKLPLVKN